ncbi:NlpC/P60 family protein [Ectobacillus sp. JY-23]|uniref:C40 family peptidase n=1 Tax=Ectobacillus sp. JY-23 TaxID=2933872 RepID=UPI001FF37F44|nr:C40 family peptidase [Ectobacillus sp. JY-23]UOY91085.1 NlpC/P60 family protein [Ectobacillus sp. JY-23]
MKQLKMVTTVIATGLIMFSTAAPQVNAERSKQTIQANIHTKEQERKEIMKQMDERLNEIKALEKTIADNETKLKQTETDISETQKLIREKTMAIDALQKKIEQRGEVIKKRLVSLQTQPTTNIVTEVVINAKSFADLLDRMNSINLLLQSDKSILEAQEKDKAQVEKDRELILQKEQQLRTFMEELQKTQQQLATDRQAKQAIWNELNDKLQAIVAAIAAENRELTKAEERDFQRLSLNLQRSDNTEDTKPAPAAPAPASPGFTAPTPAPAGGVVAKAQQYLGVPYVFGGASPRGFDCSGFISYIYGGGRKTAAGYYASATKISTPQPGDLVFFANTYKPGISHIGIYVGNGQMIHASDKGIAYSSLSSSYNRKHFAGYGRL